ncbi:hypothetical protein D3C86_1129540 [compost metagenome]
MHIVAADIAVHQGQARYAKGGEVVVVAYLPGFLPGIVVAGVVAVVGQGAAAGAVDPHPGVVAGEFLQADVEGVAAVFGREQTVQGFVVQLAGPGAAVILAVEETQVGAQGPVADRLVVGQVDELLAVDVLELGIPQTDLGALVVEHVLAALEVETVGGERGFAGHRHVVHAAVVPWAVLAELAAVERQAIDFLRGDLAATEGLRQRTTVVRTQDWQHRHPLADFHFGLRQLGLERDIGAPEVIRRATVMIQRQQLRTAGAFAAVELHRIQTQHIHAEADSALGEPGFGIEDETLRPLLSLALGLGRVGEVAIDVEVAQVQVDLGALDKTRFLGAGGQGRAGQGNGNQAGNEVRRGSRRHGLGSL